jgi:UV DNA damage repair endonuclease
VSPELLIGTWGKPDGMKGYPLGHPRDTGIAIQRHRDMLHSLYLPAGIRFIVFDPYFLALDRIPTFRALEELSLVRSDLLAFGQELDSLDIVRYGHNSHYCHFLSRNEASRHRSMHEVAYLLELAELLGMIGVGIHLSGDHRSATAVCDTVTALEPFGEDKLRRVYLENMPTPAGRIANILAIAEQIPINVAFDIGHYMSSPHEDGDLLLAIERVLDATHPPALFLHLSFDIGRSHTRLPIPFCITLIEELRHNFDVDLHIDIESPDRINDCLKLKEHFGC